MAGTDVLVTISGNSTGLVGAVGQAETAMGRLDGSVNKTSGVLTAAFTGAAIAGVAAFATGMGGAVTAAAGFEKQMSAVGAVAGATGSEMQALTSLALQLGKDTSFSAKEAAVGLEQLVKAGVSIQDIVGGGAAAALDLAAAGAVSVGEAAEIAATSMTVFGKTGAEMGAVANTISGAVNASAIDMNDFKFSMSAAGSVAAARGLNFEDTATAIAILGSAGLKGADAGTSLKTMLLNLNPPTVAAAKEMRSLGLIVGDQETIMAKLRAEVEKTEKGRELLTKKEKDGILTEKELFKIATDLGVAGTETSKSMLEWALSTGHANNQFFDMQGNLKPMREIMEQLRVALEGMSKEQQIAAVRTIFGTDAIRAAAIVAKLGAEGYDEMAEKMEKQGDVARIANERLNNLAGSWEKFTGSVETAAIMLGMTVTPALKGLVDSITEVVNQGIERLELLPEAWQGIVEAFTQGSVTTAAGLAGLTAVFGEWAGTVESVVATAGQVWQTVVLGQIVPALQQLGQMLQEFAGPIAAFTAGFSGTVVAIGLASAAIAAVTVVLGALLSPIGLVATAVGLLAAAWTTNFLGIQEQTAAAWATIQPILAELVVWLGTNIPPVLNWISTVGWPALVTAGQAVADWITGTAIPALTQLAEWLGPKIQEVTTWITGTGWPALVAIGQTVVTIVQAIITEFQLMFAELEKRQIFAEVEQLWIRMNTIGSTLGQSMQTLLNPEIQKANQFTETLAPLIQKVNDMLAPFLDLVGRIVAVSMLPAFVVAVQNTGAAFQATMGPLQAGVVAVEKFLTVISAGLTAFEKFVELMKTLSTIQLPAFNLPGLPGMSGSGVQQMSYRGGGVTAGPANPNATQAEIEAWAYQEAKARGWSDKDARDFVALISGEGAGYGAKAVGDSGQSFGPLQLYTGGGVGNQALAAGINVRDPSTWQQQIQYGMGVIEQQGAGQWTVARNQGLLLQPPKVAVPTGTGQTGQISQYNLGLSPAEASAACGPAALTWFMNLTGRTPTGTEARDLAAASGWDASRGMYGPQAFVAAGIRGGVSLQADMTPTAGEVGQLATAGTPFAISTSGTGAQPGHYYQVSGGTLGALNVGASGTALKGGSGIMSLDQILALSGPMNAIITLSGQMGEALTVAGATGAEAFTGLTATATEQSLNLVGSQTVALDSVRSVYSTASGDIIRTTVDANGQVVNQYATLANGVTIEMGNLVEGVTTTQTEMGNNLMTTVADTAGNYVTTVTTMSGAIIAQYLGMAGQVVASTAAQNTGVLQSYDVMGTAVNSSVTTLATGVQTAFTDTAGNSITTVTDMQGRVVEQFGTLANGAVVNINDMNTKSTTTVHEMAGVISTTVTDMAGNVIITTTDMSGQVVAQTVRTKGEVTQKWTETSASVVKTVSEMGLTVIGQSREMGDGLVTATKNSAGEMVSVITNAAGEVIGQFQNIVNEGQTVATGLDAASKGLKSYADGLKNVGNAAAKAADQLEEFNKQAGGKASGSGGSNPFARRQHGGTVLSGETYLVGEAGAELFTPGLTGSIVPNHLLGGGDRLVVNVYGAGTEDVVKRVLRYLRTRELLRA